MDCSALSACSWESLRPICCLGGDQSHLFGYRSSELWLEIMSSVIFGHTTFWTAHGRPDAVDADTLQSYLHTSVSGASLLSYSLCARAQAEGRAGHVPSSFTDFVFNFMRTRVGNFQNLICEMGYNLMDGCRCVHFARRSLRNEVWPGGRVKVLLCSMIFRTHGARLSEHL